MKKPAILAIVAILVLVTGVIIYKKLNPKTTTKVETETVQDLPINTIPISERPFITLSPDATGRSLDISITNAPTEGDMEYEMIYNASGKQEGALGSIFLGSEKQPIVKSILLGSKSGGGKITYHEGVTGGSLTVTYDETRLKESWNYLHYNSDEPSVSSTDAKFEAVLGKTALKKDAVVIVMKTFGYPKMEGKVVSGPYGFFTQTPIKGTAQVTLKLPAGEHVNPTIYEWNGTAWKKLTTKLQDDAVSATATANVFVVTTE